MKVLLINNITKIFKLSSSSFHLSLFSKTLKKDTLFLYPNISIRYFKCPAFPESVSEGDIRWNKNIGDFIQIDDVVCEIETDKTSVPVPSPFSGVLTEFYFEDGSKIEANQELFKIDTSASQPAASSEDIASEASSQDATDLDIKEERKDAPDSQFTASSRIDPKFQSIPTDSQSTLKSEKGDMRSETRVKMSRMRKRISDRLKEAQNTTAMLTTFNEIDMKNIMSIRSKFKDAFLKTHGVKLSFMSPFVAASAYALQAQPVVNATISASGDEIIYRDFVDVSIAVATPKGLVVPVLRNVEQMNFADIEKGIGNLAEKARTNSLAIEDMDGGTFTISNGGTFGSYFSTPIINLPQSAILGMHAIVERPVAVDSKVEIRPMMYVALTYDHRLIDGREAVLFLRKIKSAIENPETILLNL